jgi:nucleotidyltransferase substrate binding protein (TIGR01987 family)
MNKDLKLIFNQLSNALNSLEEAANLPVSHSRVEIDGTIQRFEFCIELFWKFLKKQLFIEYGIDVNGPKKVMQQAYASNLIDHEEIWIEMLDDRNLTSHTYDKALADKIYHNIKKYIPTLKDAVNNCSK